MPLGVYPTFHCFKVVGYEKTGSGILEIQASAAGEAQT